jgi:hypothetical protein
MADDPTAADALQVAQRALAKAIAVEQDLNELEAEVDAAAKDLSVLEEIVEGRSEDGGVATEEAGR